jgi:hypothetical protein
MRAKLADPEKVSNGLKQKLKIEACGGKVPSLLDSSGYETSRTAGDWRGYRWSGGRILSFSPGI